MLWRLLPLGLLSAALFAGPAQASDSCAPSPGWATAELAPAAQVLTLLNEHRGALGLPGLTVSATLQASANWKAQHMAAYGYLAHDDPAPPIARSSSQRISDCGYPVSAAVIGENLAEGITTAQAAEDAWLSSPPHRANMESATYLAVGIAAARAANGTWYWAEDFGSSLDRQADFTLGVSPSVGWVLMPGGSTRYGLIVDGIGDFAGSVKLRVDGLPRGATAAFDPNPAASSSTLAVTTSTSTAPGRYTLTITGTSGTLTHATHTTLEVEQRLGPPGIALSVTPASASATQGAGAAFTVSTIGIRGFTGKVGLALSGLPRGATGSFSANPVAAGASVRLRITTTTHTPVGRHPFTISATDARQTSRTTASLVVQAAVRPLISKPLTSPARPVAGKRFVVAFAISRSDNHQPLTAGKMTTYPAVNSTVIAHTESFLNGIARLAFTVPKNAKSKLLRVSVTIKLGGMSTTGIAAFRIR